MMMLVRMLTMMVETHQYVDPRNDFTHNQKYTTNLKQLAHAGTDLLCRCRRSRPTRHRLYIKNGKASWCASCSRSPRLSRFHRKHCRQDQTRQQSHRGVQGIFVALRSLMTAGSLPFPTMTHMSWLCFSQSASSHCARRRVKQMRPGFSSFFFHTSCVKFLSVSTSVLLSLFLVTTASLSLASFDSVLSASGS